MVKRSENRYTTIRNAAIDASTINIQIYSFHTDAPVSHPCAIKGWSVARYFIGAGRRKTRNSDMVWKNRCWISTGGLCCCWRIRCVDRSVSRYCIVAFYASNITLKWLYSFCVGFFWRGKGWKVADDAVRLHEGVPQM